MSYRIVVITAKIINHFINELTGLLTNINRRTESESSRRYIGKGCSIVTESNNVWLMNESESSVFVQVIKNMIG